MAVQLSQAALEARRKYQREYYARNRERMQAKQAAYWERQAAKEAPQQPGNVKRQTTHKRAK